MTRELSDFGVRMRERYPEGLTGIIAIGGTRTTYILSNEPDAENPGQIADPAAYAAFVRARYVELIEMFFDLGGQNLIIPVLSYQSFHERGQEYASRFARLVLWLIDEEFQQFYRDNDVDPYFCGIDTLLHLPPEHGAHAIGAAFAAFQQSWEYREGRRKLVWEVAPIPLYSFWQAGMALTDAERETFHDDLTALTDLEAMYQKVFHFYARTSLGTDLPVPHFYIGTNRNGDVKLRAPLSLSLLCGGAFRTFYTPYPTLFLTRQTLEVILDDLATGGGLRAFQKDYQGLYTRELFDAEQARVFALRDDPYSTLGLLRRTSEPDDD